MAFFISAQDFFVSKILCPQSPSFLVPRPQPAKRSEKGYGNENKLIHVQSCKAKLRYQSLLQGSEGSPCLELSCQYLLLFLVLPKYCGFIKPQKQL